MEVHADPQSTFGSMGAGWEWETSDGGIVTAMSVNRERLPPCG